MIRQFLAITAHHHSRKANMSPAVAADLDRLVTRRPWAPCPRPSSARPSRGWTRNAPPSWRPLLPDSIDVAATLIDPERSNA